MKAVCLGLVVALWTAGSAHAQSVQRIVPSGEPVASAVEIPAGGRTVFIGGQSAALRGVPHGGDTEAQTVATLRRIQDILRARRMSMGDIVLLRIFLLADPKSGKPDRERMARGFNRFFGTVDQPNLPTRTVLQINGMDDNSLVVIEAQAVHYP